MLTAKQLERRIDAAMGRIPCDLVLRGVEFLDVFSCEWKTGDLSIIDGTIVATEPGLQAGRVLDGRGRRVVPGFIDAHVHVESSLLVPEAFDGLVLGCGTTTAICDPHELANVQGVSGLEYFLDAAEKTQLDLRVMLSSCVPATHLETNGGGTLSAEDLVKLRGRSKALGLAEMMNMPGVINRSPEVMDKLEAFSDSVVDGHSPLLTGRELSAYIASGISSCHESTQIGEAAEKLSKGMSVWIREGSVAKDLRALIPLLNVARSTSLGFCTDDRNPLDILREGHIDYLVRKAIELGAIPEVAYRSASWSVARHYGLKNKGAIAPGYEADLVVLGDYKSVAVESVFRAGVPTSELTYSSSNETTFKNSIRTSLPEEKDLEAVSGNVRVIGVESGKILTESLVMASDAPGVHRLSVLERYGKKSKPANAYAYGFGENFHGAIASSVGHDSHNLIVVGDKTRDMRVALGALIECGGGFAVVKDGKVLAQLALPFGGLMTRESPKQVEAALVRLREASRSLGCGLHEPFLQLAFLSLPVIPSLKLTDKGLVDVNEFRLVDVRAA